jgi:hypothetical protein
MARLAVMFFVCGSAVPVAAGELTPSAATGEVIPSAQGWCLCTLKNLVRTGYDGPNKYDSLKLVISRVCIAYRKKYNHE